MVYQEFGRQIESPAVMALRARISLCFDQIDQRPELREPVSPATFTRAFPRVKVREFDWAKETGLIPNVAQRNQVKIDQSSMAILLCAAELRTMDKRLRKSAKDMAREEFRRRESLRVQAKTQPARKLVFSPAV